MRGLSCTEVSDLCLLQSPVPKDRFLWGLSWMNREGILSALCSPNARAKPPACVSYMASRWGTVVREAKDRWYDAQSALDCEQQLKCGFAFCRGDSPWPAWRRRLPRSLGAGSGEPGHPPSPGPVPWLPLFLKRNPVLGLQVTMS